MLIPNVRIWVPNSKPCCPAIVAPSAPRWCAAPQLLNNGLGINDTPNTQYTIDAPVDTAFIDYYTKRQAHIKTRGDLCKMGHGSSAAILVLSSFQYELNRLFRGNLSVDEFTCDLSVPGSFRLSFSGGCPKSQNTLKIGVPHHEGIKRD